MRLQDQQYKSAGRTSTARSKMDDMMAARRKEKDEKTQTAAPQEQERPKI